MNRTLPDILRVGTIKRFARQTMRGKWLRSILVVLIYALVANGPSFIVSYLTSSEIATYIMAFYRIAISGPLIMGMTVYFLDVLRGTDEPGLGSFGKGFAFGAKAIQLYVTVLAFVILWSFLFIIPGIVAAIKYSQSFYILADNPWMSPYECIRRSKLMVFGIKGRFFLLWLSFIGWSILLNIPSVLASYRALNLTGPLSVEAIQMEIERAASTPLATVLGILGYLVLVYRMAAEACFYDMVSGNLKIYTEVASDVDSQEMY